jgi:hypothetical protein
VIPKFTGMKEYSEICLGEQSKNVFLKNMISALGFEHSGPTHIDGLSGLKHEFDAIGKRGSNILLVVGGAEYLKHMNNKKSSDRLSPRERMEKWRDQALLSAYDVQAALVQDKMIVDLMFFHNVNNNKCMWPSSQIELGDWIKNQNLPKDMGISLSASVEDIPTMSREGLINVAHSIGSSFLTLDDLSIEEIVLLTNENSAKNALAVCNRLRLKQHFNPPTDELVLMTYDLTHSSNVDLPVILYETSVALGHQPIDNILVPAINFKDPVATAKELENSKYIEFKSKTEITEKGYKITQSIRKTAQGSFVIRLLQNIGLPDLAKAIISVFKPR